MPHVATHRISVDRTLGSAMPLPGGHEELVERAERRQEVGVRSYRNPMTSNNCLAGPAPPWTCSRGTRAYCQRLYRG